MMEIGSKYSTFCERHIPMYKLDNLIFKRIDQFIRLPRWLNRVKYENQTGVCTDNLTTILQSNPRELLTNMSQIKHYYKSLYLDYDKLMDVIPRAHVPTILSKQRIEQECLHDLVEHGDTMNEIITDEFNPSALFYIEGNSSNSTKKSKADQVLELYDIFPYLPIVKINKKYIKLRY